MNKIKEALHDMVWQFAYRDTKNDKPMLWTGGLSALEGAFEALGWSNPHFVDEVMECDIEGCHNWYSPQIHWDGMYVLICDLHARDYLVKKPRPKMKQRAIDREASRDPITRCLPISH
jgi:hypothetical protein